MLKNILGGDLEPGLNFVLPGQWYQNNQVRSKMINDWSYSDPNRQLDGNLPRIDFGEVA